MKLTPDFHKKLKKIINNELEEKKYKDIFSRIVWDKEAERCFQELKSFFAKLDAGQFKGNEIGVIDIRWNEYGGDVEVDFMPENDLDVAFSGGCRMNSSAINNDAFFRKYFECSGKESFGVIDRDYTALIRVFYNMIAEIASSLAEVDAVKALDKKDPYYITFAFFHDDEPDVVYSS